MTQTSSEATEGRKPNSKRFFIITLDFQETTLCQRFQQAKLCNLCTAAMRSILKMLDDFYDF